MYRRYDLAGEHMGAEMGEVKASPEAMGAAREGRAL